MQKEFEFLKIIEKTLSDSSYLGDDCANLPEFNLVLSTDSLVEGVHFRLDLMTPYEIAKKALLVNISDILASGAKANYALISLGGKIDPDFVSGFYSGINEIASLYNIKIIGGDLVSSEKVIISITILGNTKKRNISSRKNARDGYIVAVAGEFGSSALGLKELIENPLSDSEFIKIHKEPKLYPEVSDFISKNIKTPYAMMDSSDGLCDCLYQIASKSGVRIDIEYDKIPKKTTDRELVLYGGEDYCLVVCVSREEFDKFTELKLAKIGTCSLGEGVFIDGVKLKYKGFNHFE